MTFFFDVREAVLEDLKKNNKTFVIDHNKKSGEFRYEVQLSKESLNYLRQKDFSLDLNKLLIVNYFYSMKDAVKYCEENYLKFEE